MALTTCKECGREISTEAAACPGCGAPMATTESRPARVMRAGAKWEGWGFLLIVGGMVVAMATQGATSTVAGAVAVAGIVVFLIGRFQ